ncbi:MAG: tRNA pseudouridine(38-40) synthase TruA [Pirellulales bacterium]|nr:tRNA pseudouridine(38-40) synthase TruA [Pirellulales bacterium]
MRTLKLTLAYDGTDFAGWQTQPGARTVQGVLEDAIGRITGEAVRAVASGRTDAGVHAAGQVASVRAACRLDAPTLQRALNAELPRDVAVLDVAEAPEDFHPIRDAVAKRYRYVIHDGPVRDVFARAYSWHYPSRLDDDAMRQAAQSLLGRHDFRSFESSGAPRATSVRTIRDILVERTGAGQGDWIRIEVEADGFLYNMVRAIVGTLVEVGRGAREPDWVRHVLEATDRAAAGPTAPPHGLILLWVRYG